MSVKRLATIAVAMLMLGALLPSGALAKPGGGGGPNQTPVKTCPATLDGFLAADNVDAYSTGTGVVTYFFSSLEDQNPVNGVPGLVGYCVYTDGDLSGADAMYGEWKANFNAGNVSFVRNGGNKTNIPLDGTTDIQIGTATFDTNPTSQTILLHIADAATCQALYGGDSTTCFVLPKPAPPEPVCDDGSGSTDAAYNAIPYEVEHCGPPSLGFEAEQTNEFGDEVALDTAGGTELVSLTVDFQSYACSESGQWYTADCVTTPGTTFTVPGGITANIYDPSDLTTPIASVTANPSIPYRPSAVNDALCPNAPVAAANSRFIDPVYGTCFYSISYPITFTFAPGTTFTDGQEVVWTVEFNTFSEGYSPIGIHGGYDSLNVGVPTGSTLAFAGTDVDEDVAFRSFQGNGDALAAETGWSGYRPLGQIVLGP